MMWAGRALSKLHRAAVQHGAAPLSAHRQAAVPAPLRYTARSTAQARARFPDEPA